jgi:hypothetical protein
MHKNGGIIGSGYIGVSVVGMINCAAGIAIGCTGLGVSHAHQLGWRFKSVIATAAAGNFRHRPNGPRSVGF